MPDDEHHEDPSAEHDAADPGGEHDSEDAGSEHGTGHEGPTDLERAVAVGEAVAKAAEAAHEAIESAQHGHAGIAAGQIAHGVAGLAGSLVEATVGHSDEAHEAAEAAEAVLEAFGAGSEAYVASEEAARALTHSAASGSGHGSHTDRAHHADDAAHAASGHDDREIELEIECSADPDHRLRVASIELEEKLGDVYLAKVHVASEIRWDEQMVAATDLLGADVKVSINRGGATRTIRGLVRHVEEEGTSSTHLNMRLEVVPAMALLAQQVDSRVFWELSAVEVLTSVLEASLAPYGREIALSGMIEREPREYCVQYQESDLDFVHRLLEEEGLSYYFDHDATPEKVTIFETNEQLPGLRGDHQDYLHITDGAHGHAEQDAITEMKEMRRVVPTSVAISDHDWRQNRTTPISVSPDDPQDDRGRARPVYDHGRGLALGAQPGGHDGERQVRLRKELLTRDAIGAMGRSTAIGLSAGVAFTTLDDRDLAPLQGRTWIVTRVMLRASDPRVHAIVGGEGSGESRYENHFECIPFDVPYRPSRRTPKPRIYGMQTGVVVGPHGQPIFSDAHRRVRVRFHWDRYRPNDTYETQDQDRHSCWVRVSQAWAGFGYGTLFLPRVGMEVVVSFIDGDPDRPIVAGCVYNGENPAPYTGDDQWTMSTLKTLTVDGSDLGPGYNELRFEDKKGSEQVFVHAERDLDEVVEHDHSTRVKRNQSNTVDGDQTELVGGDQTMTVRDNRTVRIEKNENISVLKNQRTTVEKSHTECVYENQSSNIGGLRDVYVGKTDTEIFNGGRRVTVEQFDNTTVSANKNTHVTAQYNITADEHFHLAQGRQELHLGSAHAVLSSPGGDIRLDNDKARIQCLPTGEIQIESDTKIVLKVGESFIKILPGIIEIGSSTLYFHASGQKRFMADESNTAVLGPRVSVQASGPVDVKGCPVRLNT